MKWLESSRFYNFFEEAAEIITESRSPEHARTALNDIARLSARGVEQKSLAKEAREIRDRNGGNFLIVRASLEFSNYCRQNCSFCGMNAKNRELSRYRMSYEQISRVVDDVVSIGVTDLHLAS